MRRQRPHLCSLVILTSAGLLASAVAPAQTIPPNPFVSRLEAPGRLEPVGIDASISDQEDTADELEIGLEVVGAALSGEVRIITLRRDQGLVFSVAEGEVIDDNLKVIEIGDHHVTLERIDDNTLLQIELIGGYDD